MTSAENYYRPTYQATDHVIGVQNGWSWSTYFQGMYALFLATGDQQYFDDLMAWGRSNHWFITRREPNPDAMKAGQTYYDLHQRDQKASLVAMDEQMAKDISKLPDNSYYWIDALFMGLPNWTRWSMRTGRDTYLDKMDSLFRWTRDDGISDNCSGAVAPGLYSPVDHLWFHDCHYIGRTDDNGREIFWARGNGYVLAAMAQVLSTLPKGSPHAAPYIEMLKTMSDRIRGLQGADGFWRSSLIDPSLHPSAETSGTALFTYAIALGMNSGVLDRNTYLPMVIRAWNGLTREALRPNGFLTNCQSSGREPADPYTGIGPGPATATPASSLELVKDSPPFCVGTFLLAGSEIAKLRDR